MVLLVKKALTPQTEAELTIKNDGLLGIGFKIIR
jgi:hypothetical protein